MSSLSARLLISVSVLLLLFFGATVVVLDTAFRTAGEQARRDILDGHLMQLLAAANPNDEGALSFPPDLHEERFNTIGSGLYGELRDDGGQLTWRSRSALGLEIPQGGFPRLGTRVFERESLDDGTPLLTLSLAVQWEFPDGELKPYVFKVAESLDSFNAQVAEFRRQLIGWFAAIALIMLLSISILMRGLLRPLRQIETEIGDIEEGKRASLSEKFPTELTGVARNMNLLIDNERARSDRYRNTLDNLAHSLKTPLAAMRALIADKESSPQVQSRFNEQIERMDEIVRYQLRKPAASTADNLVLGPVPVAKEVERLVSGLRKVYHDKQPTIEAEVAPDMKFRGDTLLDNACKWCKGRVSINVRPSGNTPAAAGGMRLTVNDDGPGIPQEAAEALLERGTRLDEATPGHGIGLAIVRDIAKSYGGSLTIGQSSLGGACITVDIPPAAERR
jgi:two-component system sensor histidine kinase PhoQ